MSFPSVYMSCVLAVCTMVHHVQSHGWLVDPPARSSLWQAGFDTPPNYNHHELNCGGLARQSSLGGKCGLCGDPYDGERHNEAGGKYAQGIITRTYRQGQIIQIIVNITAAHGGYFEFKLCANNDFDTAITQECLDRHVLTRADNPAETRYSDVPFGNYQVDRPKSFVAHIGYVLPEDLICNQCVLQWKYTTAHNPGAFYQEEFYGCSDVAIVASGVTMVTPLTTSANTITTSPKITTKLTTRASTTTSAKLTTPKTASKTVPESTTAKTTSPPTTTSTTRERTRATTPAITTSSRATFTTTRRLTTGSSPKTTPSRTPGETTTTPLTFVELYQRCKAKGVIEDVFTKTCRELCVRPSECPKTFCNPYCVLLHDAKP